jgi:hypothetical protein
MFLTTVYSNQNQWDFGLCPLSGILNTRKHIVSETTQLDPLEGANLRTEIDSVFETFYFLVLRINRRRTKFKNLKLGCLRPVACVRSGSGVSV